MKRRALLDEAGGYAVVLTSAAGVADNIVEEVCRFIGVPRSQTVRLGERSVEIHCENPISDRAALSGSVGAEPVDINCVPMHGRRKSILIADMDSTIIPVECIDELADFTGVRDQVSQITEQVMCGELEFEDALRARVALLRGLGVEVLKQCYDERVSLNPGARTLVQTMNANGGKTALISGGFEYFADRVGEAAGFEICRANRLLYADGHLTGEVVDPILGREAKLEALNRISTRAGFGAYDVLAIGDGANDLSMVEAAGLGVAYRAKPALREGADVAIDHSDLTAALALQGYFEADYLS